VPKKYCLAFDCSNDDSFEADFNTKLKKVSRLIPTNFGLDINFSSKYDFSA